MSQYLDPKEYLLAIELGAGPFISPMMGRKFVDGYASVEFYDGPVSVTEKGNVVSDGASIVAPVSGELTLTATDSEDKDLGSYGSIPNGVIDVSDAYDRPNWGGPARFLKVEESVAIAGAAYAVVRILRS